MNNDNKTFDVGRPQASPTSKPIIVGHRPVITDPMMRRPQPPPPISETLPTHTAKEIPVSAEIKENINAAVKPLEHLKEQLDVPAPPPSTPPAPQASVIQPTAPQIDPFAQAPQVMQAPPQITAAPAAAEPHLQSLPMSHAPNDHSRIKVIVTWSSVFVILALVAAYLAIDAGLITTSIKLPFHIFTPQ